MSQSSIPNDTLYIARVDPTKDHISVQCIGMNRVGVESYYVYDELSKGTWANAWIRR